MAAEVAAHYSGGDFLARLESALLEDGADPLRPTLEALAPYDQFHGRGLEATEELAARLPVRAADRLLDVGSGAGGPARWLARRFGCRVAGLDLSEDLCALARELNRRTGMESQVSIDAGSALAMPYPDASFDGAVSMNVSMNIADKAALYRELRRVLKPGGWLALSELALGPGPALDYPVPWATDPSASFLATREDTVRALAACGFEVQESRETTAENLDFMARSRAAVAAGGKPPHRAVPLFLGASAKAAMANTGRGIAERRIVPIEILARRA